MKIKNCIALLFFFCFANLFSQEKHIARDTTVYTIVEQMPQFPGGTAEMMKFIQTNVKYPKKEKDMGVQGKVFVRYVVEADGSVGETEIIKGVAGGKALEDEAVRVVKMMPKWIPGYQSGKAVRVWFNLPIYFKLNDLDPKTEKK